MEHDSVEGHTPQHRTHHYGAGGNQVQAQAESEAQNQEDAWNYRWDWSVLHELDHRPVVPHNERVLGLHVGFLQLDSCHCVSTCWAQSLQGTADCGYITGTYRYSEEDRLDAFMGSGYDAT